MTELRDIYRAAASRFLQSVVVVDDETALTDEDREQVAPEMIDPRPRPSPAPVSDKDAGTSDIVQDAAPDAIDEYRLDVRTLIDRFAALGIVCAALSPADDLEEADDPIITAGRRADMVTLDWHLGDAGERAGRLLDLLSRPGNERLRLIAVYTRDTDNDSLVQQITDLDGVEPIEGLRFQRGSTRIVLLFKEGSNRPELEGKVVAVTDLPDRLVEEFTDLAAGLVSAATMSALGAVREAMPEILGVLNADLDAAYVGHRLALDRPDDAVDHLAELIVSELRSVVDDDAGRIAAADGDAVRLWLDNIDDDALTVEPGALQRLNQEGSSTDGRPTIAEQFPRYGGKKKCHPTEFVISAPDEADLADARLAERMTTRYRYTNARPERLELGVVIRSASDERYWVCVQPLCDSVRLEEFCRMPLLPYVPADGKKGIHLALVRTDGPVMLRLSLKPADLHVITFPCEPTAKAVVAIPLEDGPVGFLDDKGEQWELVCRLKPDHAQRISYRLATEIGRVGLNESEWLRIKTNLRTNAKGAKGR